MTKEKKRKVLIVIFALMITYYIVEHILYRFFNIDISNMIVNIVSFIVIVVSCIIYPILPYDPINGE